MNDSFELDRVAIRMVKEPPLYSDVNLNSPQAVVKLMADTLKDMDREVFAVVNLRTDLKPINVNFVSVGAMNEAMVHPREVLKSIVLSNALGVMLVHNHVTGNSKPSPSDITLTDRLAQLCGLLGVQLYDHVIVGPGDTYYSFAEKDALPVPSFHLARSMDELEIGGLKVAEETEMKTQKKVSFTVAECGEFHDVGEFHENVESAKEALAILGHIPEGRMHGVPAIGICVTDVAQPEVYTEVDIATAKCIDMEVLGFVPEIAENKAAQFALAELIHAMPEAEIRGEVPEVIQKKVQMIESREKQADQLKEITDKLEQGVADVFSSDKYKQFLDTMAKFPRYSVNNTILIMMQKPDAQVCQSFTGWKEMGRYVKKGEKGIKILAPAPYTIQKEQNVLDEKGSPVLDHDGEPLRETVEVKINAFKVVNTFDISQTDGKELPSIGVNELTGDVERYQMMFEALKQSCPVPIAFENIPSGAKGYYNKLEKRIALQEGMSEVQTVKTLIHEMAHQKLHDTDNAADSQSRSSKEVEAESVAYTVCQHYGIDTSDYSFSYVVGWSEGKEMRELKASLDTIRRAAAEMIGAIDGKIEELMKDVLTAKDVTKLKGISHEYYSGSREDEYMFSCEVKGEPQTMIYTISRHDDGERFSIVTDKTNVWEHMSAQELRKLEETVGQAAELFDWEKRIESVTAGEIEELKFRFMDNEGSRLTREQSDKVWSAIEKKEKSFQQSKSEKTSGKKQSQKESKSAEKPSVKEKLKENKVKKKKPEKKGKEVVACL